MENSRLLQKKLSLLQLHECCGQLMTVTNAKINYAKIFKGHDTPSAKQNKCSFKKKKVCHVRMYKFHAYKKIYYKFFMPQVDQNHLKSHFILLAFFY